MDKIPAINKFNSNQFKIKFYIKTENNIKWSGFGTDTRTANRSPRSNSSDVALNVICGFDSRSIPVGKRRGIDTAVEVKL